MPAENRPVSGAGVHQGLHSGYELRGQDRALHIMCHANNLSTDEDVSLGNLMHLVECQISDVDGLCV